MALIFWVGYVVVKVVFHIVTVLHSSIFSNVTGEEDGVMDILEEVITEGFEVCEAYTLELLELLGRAKEWMLHDHG